jgi:2,3-bisphosphoglycerate-dependent phosphoglycerate mutase
MPMSQERALAGSEPPTFMTVGHQTRSMATILLVRHGETEWNRTRRIQGWAPVPLNDRGREQARAVGEHLTSAYEIDRVVCSDLQRTRETASLIGEAGLGVDPSYDRNWRERDLGVLQGLPYDEAFEDNPEYDVTNGDTDRPGSKPENGESMLDLRDRVLTGWKSVSEPSRTGETGDDTTLVVTHGGPIYALLGHIGEGDFATASNRAHQENCSVNEIDLADGEATIIRENDTSYRAGD